MTTKPSTTPLPDIDVHFRGPFSVVDDVGCRCLCTDAMANRRPVFQEPRGGSGTELVMPGMTVPAADSVDALIRLRLFSESPIAGLPPEIPTERPSGES